MKNQFYILLFLIFISMTGYAQKSYITTEGVIVNKDSLQAHVEYLYFKLIHSPSYEVACREQNAYLLNIHFILNESDIRGAEKVDYNGWAKAHLDKTEFKTAAEAERGWNNLCKVQGICWKENEEYYTTLVKLLGTDEGIEVWKSAIAKIAVKYPDKAQPDPMSRLFNRY